MKRLERLLGVALLLSARRRLRAQDLAKHFDVTLRTIYRDVRALEQAGFPVTGTAGDGYVLPASAQLRPLAFDPLEAESLMLAARLLEKSADEPVSARLRSAMAKLEAALTSEARRRVRDHRRSVLLPGERRKSAGPLALILEAVTDRLVLDLTYAGIARGEVTRREIEPLGAVWFSKLWLIPAWCRLRQDLRNFRLDRILEARPTGERFGDRPGMTLEDVVRMHTEEATTAS